jgi:ribulose-phosphate 3-epimerase
MYNQLRKISAVKKMIGSRKIELEVDGGINLDTGREAINAGADVLVSGSTIFNSKKYKNIIEDLKNL